MGKFVQWTEGSGEQKDLKKETFLKGEQMGLGEKRGLHEQRCLSEQRGLTAACATDASFSICSDSVWATNAYVAALFK